MTFTGTQNLYRITLRILKGHSFDISMGHRLWVTLVISYHKTLSTLLTSNPKHGYYDLVRVWCSTRNQPRCTHHCQCTDSVSKSVLSLSLGLGFRFFLEAQLTQSQAYSIIVVGSRVVLTALLLIEDQRQRRVVTHTANLSHTGMIEPDVATSNAPRGRRTMKYDRLQPINRQA